MSLIRINVADRQSVVTGERHGSDTDRLVAALTAEPETIEELELAFRRFARDDCETSVFEFFSRHKLSDPSRCAGDMNLEPYDAGILVIDLAGRTVASESTYSYASSEGIIPVRDRLSDDPEEIDFGMPYQVSDDWEFVDSIEEFECRSAERRKARIDEKPVDTREILFGDPMLRFFAEELRKSEIPENEKLRSHLHGLWLLTEREDLNGKSPREVLLAKREFIDLDLQTRSLQWSFTKDIPSDLPEDSHAYLYAGFGTHEIVVYYDLIRYLMDTYWQRLSDNGFESIEAGAKYLGDLKEKWLREPNAEFSGRVPAEIIDSERRRRNLTMSPHECIIDEDCPICVEMSQIFDTPMFWHLDGSHMDREFAFSFYQTYEEWQKEELAFEAFMKREIVRSDTSDADDVENFIREMKF